MVHDFIPLGNLPFVAGYHYVPGLQMLPRHQERIPGREEIVHNHQEKQRKWWAF